MAPRSKKQFEALREKSRGVIKEAALELFAHQGFHNTSIAQIASKAGISKGLVYNYFESKEHLLEIIIKEEEIVGKEFVESHLSDETKSPKERLEYLLTDTFSLIDHQFAHYKLLMSLVFQEEIMERMKDTLKDIRKDSYGKMLQILSEMGVEDTMSEMLFIGAVLDGYVLHLISMGEGYPKEKMKQHIINKFCK